MRLIDADSIHYVEIGRGVEIALASDIDKLPTVSPDDLRPVGKWIAVTNGRGGHECGVCHDYAPSFQDGSERLSNYCPSCGARLLGGKNDKQYQLYG